MTEKARYFSDSHREALADLRAEFERKPAEHVVITGYKAITPLGDENQTFYGLLEEKSAITHFDVGNWRTSIAGPLPDFDMDRFYPRDRDKRRTSRVAAMAEALAVDASNQANLLDENNKLHPDVQRDRVAVWIGSGIGPVQEIVNVYQSIKGQEDPMAGSKDIDPFTGLRIFPQDVAGRPASRIGAQGWSGSTVEACATGASNFIDAYRLIKDGHADIAITGGVEDALSTHPETALGVFAQMRIISRRNDDPTAASRPFDSDRDGFVLSSGGAVFVLESLESAQRRGVKIYGEVLSAAKSVDGGHPTSLDPDNVARTIFRGIQDEKSKKLYLPDAIFAHATSTDDGDELEAQAFTRIFKDHLKDIPVTAIKSALGHLLGGAGAVNIAMALKSIENSKVPPIRNLQNPQDKFNDLYLVRGKPLPLDIQTALTVAYGFGGFNAAALVGAPR